VLAVAVLSRLGQRLANVCAEGCADALEREVEAASQGLHAGSCAKRDQSNDQGVFNQILTLFTAGQILELNVQLQKHGIHCVFSP